MTWGNDDRYCRYCGGRIYEMKRGEWHHADDYPREGPEHDPVPRSIRAIVYQDPDDNRWHVGDLYVTLFGVRVPVELVEYDAKRGRAIVRLLNGIIAKDSLGKAIEWPRGAEVDLSQHKVANIEMWEATR